MRNLHHDELSGIAHYLAQDGLLSPANAKNAVAAAKSQGVALTTYLVKSNLVSSQAIVACCEKHFGLPVADLSQLKDSILRNPLCKLELISRYRVIPLNHHQESLHLGIADPTDHAAISAISFHTGLRVYPVLVSETDLEDFINTYCHPHILYSQLETT